MDAIRQNLYKSNMVKSSVTAQIQNYNLFGESADLPDVVHCETIATRSSLHNWELVPHRHARLHQILLIEVGGGNVEIDGKRHSFGAATCINIPAGCVHGFSFSPDTQGWVVTIATEILDQTLHEQEGLAQSLGQPRLFVDSMALKPAVRLLFEEYAASAYARAQVLRALCGLLLGLVARLAAQADESDQIEQHQSLFRRFQSLVDSHFTEQWPVARYADALAVTPGHLSRISRQASGVSASAIIEQRIIREARRLLAYTNLSIAEVAYELGYIDPAYFSRVFTRANGHSPRQFRRDLGG